MPNESMTAWRERYGALQRRLAGDGAARELDALKSEIGALFKQLEQEIGELSALRDDVKQLVERWKALRAKHGGGNGNSGRQVAVPSNAPQFSGERPLVHADHLGASTFIEKGWSKLSL